MCQYSGDICVLHWPAGCQDSGSNGLPKADETSICSSPRFPALKVGLIQRQYQRALSGTPCKEGFVKDSTVISPEITFKPFLEVFSCSVFYSGYMSRIHALQFFVFYANLGPTSYMVTGLTPVPAERLRGRGRDEEAFGRGADAGRRPLQKFGPFISVSIHRGKLYFPWKFESQKLWGDIVCHNIHNIHKLKWALLFV